jgi:hypothetical protein
MNLKQFIAALKATNKKWQLSLIENKIRTCDYEYCCPISSLENKPFSDWYIISIKLGIPEELRQAIVVAADNHCQHDPNIRELRNLLLDACGLKGIKNAA